jgi:DNA-binding GntR family transcriptional regulator
MQEGTRRRTGCQLPGTFPPQLVPFARGMWRVKTSAIDPDSQLMARASISPRRLNHSRNDDSDLYSSDRVVDRITLGILAGRIVPGQRLVEADLTRTLGVSRSPVREAFRRLDALGILARTMHRGASVRTLTREEAVDLIEATLPLTVFAARSSAERFVSTPRGFDAAKFRRELQQFRDRQEDAVNLLVQRQHFYNLLVEASGNSQLPSIMPNMRIQLLRLQIHSFADQRDRRDHLDDYAAVAKAILIGNADAAQAALTVHERRTRSILLGLPDAAFQRPLTD